MHRRGQPGAGVGDWAHHGSAAGKTAWPHLTSNSESISPLHPRAPTPPSPGEPGATILASELGEREPGTGKPGSLTVGHLATPEPPGQPQLGFTPRLED